MGHVSFYLQSHGLTASVGVYIHVFPKLFAHSHRAENHSYLAVFPWKNAFLSISGKRTFTRGLHPVNHQRLVAFIDKSEVVCDFSAIFVYLPKIMNKAAEFYNCSRFAFLSGKCIIGQYKHHCNEYNSQHLNAWSINHQNITLIAQRLVFHFFIKLKYQ